MPDPTFLLIGAQKCGTSWLSEMIRQHPDVFAPPLKELHFFNKEDNYQKGLEWYRSLFSDHKGEKAIGEFTPNYMWTSLDEREIEESRRTRNIPELVYQHYPEIKLIVTLRDPVSRAVSAFYHHIRERRIHPQSRILNVGHRYGIISIGFYDVHLHNWLQVFPRDQFLIFFYETDIVQNKEQTLRGVYRFLGVDEGIVPENIHARHNPRDSHLYMYLHYYFPRVTYRLAKVVPVLNWIDFPKIEVSDEEVGELSRLYSPHKQALASLLECRLPWPA